MGDDSLLSVMIEALRDAAPELRITALTKKPKKMRLQYGVRCISRTNILKIHSEMKHAKLMISGGGSLLQDGTSTKSLYYYIAVMNWAYKMKLPLMLYANGIGPLYGEKNKKLSAEAIKRASAVTLREPASLTELKNLGLDVDGAGIGVRVSADPAFLLRGADAERIQYLKDRAGFVPGRKYFAVSLKERHNFGKTSAAQADVSENLVREIAGACRRLKETQNMYPVFIPMHPYMDTEICEKVCGSPEVEGAIMLRGLTAKELSGILDGMEFVLGMRLHILIYASQLGIPVIGLSYDPKIDALMDYIEQPYLVDVIHVTADAIMRYAEEIERNRGEIVSRLNRSAERMRSLASSDARLAAELAGHRAT
jgi:polysaccharide pyruvyl transferase CsaB